MRGAQRKRTTRACTLRLNSTDAELKLWYRLRSRSLGGFKFVRQEPIGPFVVDFACRERHLVVEVDGGQHAERQSYDDERSRTLSKHGFEVLRFWDNDVLTRIDSVKQAIWNALQEKRPPPSHPSP